MTHKEQNDADTSDQLGPKLRVCENSFCGHRSIACHLATPPEKYLKNKKNEGPLYLTSVSMAFCSPSAMASMTVNSFSSIELSNLSM